MPAKKDNYYCKTCEKNIRYRQAVEHHKKDHDVWHVSETGELDHRYAEAKKEEVRTSTTTKILDESGADIEEHYKGFKEPPEILFIYYPGGKIERFWDRFPDHQSIYTALVDGKYFEGTPAEFVEASAQFMLAAAGYESVPCIIPVDMKPAYDETARLIKEGVLIVIHGEDGKMTLEVNHETEGKDGKDNVAEVRVQPGTGEHQPEQVSPGREEEKPSQAE